jgi:hypothetical protein
VFENVLPDGPRGEAADPVTADREALAAWLVDQVRDRRPTTEHEKGWRAATIWIADQIMLGVHTEHTTAGEVAHAVGGVYGAFRDKLAEAERNGPVPPGLRAAHDAAFRCWSAASDELHHVPGTRSNARTVARDWERRLGRSSGGRGPPAAVAGPP